MSKRKKIDLLVAVLSGQDRENCSNCELAYVFSGDIRNEIFCMCGVNKRIIRPNKIKRCDNYKKKGER